MTGDAAATAAASPLYFSESALSPTGTVHRPPACLPGSRFLSNGDSVSSTPPSPPLPPEPRQPTPSHTPPTPATPTPATPTAAPPASPASPPAGAPVPVLPLAYGSPGALRPPTGRPGAMTAVAYASIVLAVLVFLANWWYHEPAQKLYRWSKPAQAGPPAAAPAPTVPPPPALTPHYGDYVGPGGLKAADRA